MEGSCTKLSHCRLLAAEKVMERCTEHHTQRKFAQKCSSKEVKCRNALLSEPASWSPSELGHSPKGRTCLCNIVWVQRKRGRSARGEKGMAVVSTPASPSFFQIQADAHGGRWELCSSCMLGASECSVNSSSVCHLSLALCEQLSINIVAVGTKSQDPDLPFSGVWGQWKMQESAAEEALMAAYTEEKIWLREIKSSKC